MAGPVGFHFEGSPELPNLDDPTYYMAVSYVPERQAVVMLSRVLGRPSVMEKIRWLDIQLSHMQCPYPIKHIEFTFTGDAVVDFVSESACVKAMARSPLKWDGHDIPIRQCLEDDVFSLHWVGISGTPQELYPFVRPALQQFGDVKGEYAPHPSSGMSGGMLKFYFHPSNRKRLPPTIQFIRPDRPKNYPPTTVKVFTAEGPFAPKCSDFGKGHNALGCPECCRRRLQQQAGA